LTLDPADPEVEAPNNTQILEAIRKLNYAADTGAADAYVVNLPVALAAHVPGMPLRFLAANSNTGASTINVCGLGAVAIVTPGGGALAAGAIVAGQVVSVAWDGTAYRMVSATANLPPASETVVGGVELATAAEAQAWSDDDRAITPAKLAAAFQGSNQLISGNGYQKLPGGLIIQWGGQTVSAGDGSSHTFTYPIAFPNAELLAFMSSTSGTVASSSGEGANITGSSATQLQWSHNWSIQIAQTYRFLIIGY
jgi:hypothetical protein